MNFAKVLRSPFLKDTSGGCFCIYHHNFWHLGIFQNTFGRILQYLPSHSISSDLSMQWFIPSHRKFASMHLLLPQLNAEGLHSSRKNKFFLWIKYFYFFKHKTVRETTLRPYILSGKLDNILVLLFGFLFCFIHFKLLFYLLFTWFTFISFWVYSKVLCEEISKMLDRYCLRKVVQRLKDKEDFFAKS